MTQSDDAVTVAYTEGQGLVVLFVNGWALSRRYWQVAITDLASDYTCVTFDARGVGESHPLRPGMSVAVGRLAADAVAPGAPVHLVTHSNGCLATARFAGAHSARIASLTIINAGAFSFNPRQVGALRAFMKLSVRLRTLTATPVGRYTADIGAVRTAGAPLLLIVGKDDRMISHARTAPRLRADAARPSGWRPRTRWGTARPVNRWQALVKCNALPDLFRVPPIVYRLPPARRDARR